MKTAYLKTVDQKLVQPGRKCPKPVMIYFLSVRAGVTDPALMSSLKPTVLLLLVIDFKVQSSRRDIDP